MHLEIHSFCFDLDFENLMLLFHKYLYFSSLFVFIYKQKNYEITIVITKEVKNILLSYCSDASWFLSWPFDSKTIGVFSETVQKNLKINIWKLSVKQSASSIKWLENFQSQTMINSLTADF